MPADEPPAAFDWRLLRGCYVFVQPVPGARADHGMLQELGAELVEAGAAAIVLFDGSGVVGDWFRAREDRPEVDRGR
ncbi:MAG: hypothetical protein IT469_03675 [Pseudomonadales bacterium]|nr:hypothetical protein [Pseudomonadales bacterium]